MTLFSKVYCISATVIEISALTGGSYRIQCAASAEEHHLPALVDFRRQRTFPLYRAALT